MRSQPTTSLVAALRQLALKSPKRAIGSSDAQTMARGYDHAVTFSAGSRSSLGATSHRNRVPRARLLAGCLAIAVVVAFEPRAVLAADPFDALRVMDSNSGGYAIFDSLFLQRDNDARQRPLVVDTASGSPRLSTGQLQPDVGIGPRIFVGRRVDDDWGWEAGYFGVYDMTFTRTLTAPGTLAIDGPLGDGPVFPFGQADSVVASYDSSINSVEFNSFVSWGDRGVISSRGWQEGFGFDWLEGVRYFGLAEQARLGFTCCTTETPPGLTSQYAVATSNNLVGWQIGGRGRRAWTNWAVEGWSKVGLFANFQTQNQAAIIDPVGTGFVYRPSRFERATTAAMVADLNLSLVRRLSDTWSVRAGYNVIWVGGVAAAPDQWDFSTSAAAGTGLDSGSWVFLSGANLGLEARW